MRSLAAARARQREGRRVVTDGISDRRLVVAGKARVAGRFRFAAPFSSTCMYVVYIVEMSFFSTSNMT